MERLLSVVCPSGGLVVDPFCGSGSTGVAAANLGMSFVGVDRSVEYAGVATKRVKEAAQSISLFAD